MSASFKRREKEKRQCKGDRITNPAGQACAQAYNSHAPRRPSGGEMFAQSQCIASVYQFPPPHFSVRWWQEATSYLKK